MSKAPEAASDFTACDLQARGNEFLERNDCFVVCDSDGATVDSISYQVKAVQPLLQLERATTHTGDKCGSSLIDTEFKSWLRDAVGRDKYAERDPVNAKQYRISPITAETGVMKIIITRFNAQKEAFSNLKQGERGRFDYPLLSGVLIQHVAWLTQGRHELKKIMNSCVNDVTKLITYQVNQVGKGKNRRVKSLLLVGGFGVSPYLQQELEKSVARKQPPIAVHRPLPGKSLTAFVHGGVIYGVETSRRTPVKCIAATTKGYETTIWSRVFWHPTKSCAKGKHDFPVYFYLHDDDSLPERSKTGQHEVEPIEAVKADLSGYLDHDPRLHPHHLTPGGAPASDYRSSIGPLKWRFTLSATSIQAELHLKDARIGEYEIKWSATDRRIVRVRARRGKT
ncbi:hypothetical protein DOTSEDRAFT_55117 [Dothistroma septosporum NZE10]|uniref:Uncharacterized protein n=1 Tax=Dothistroma septosporum (strain NZE10 / CBS 128990) TaxID=675120 RepID=N1PI90_DOTSN|nr:hypothetical protein DOTSEDRAFT_55117 [Dothistroma septosporum NZE10]